MSTIQKKSEALFEEAVKYIPGGVNSPVRAYGSVGMTPRFIETGKGAYITDADGNEYIDYIGSWGPMILGHGRDEVLRDVHAVCDKGMSFGAATAIEIDMAKFLCERIPHVEMIRMVNSGTEAVMSAIRVARGFTKRNKIVKFEGCYHGHSDCLLVKAGSGAMTSGIPDSAGVPKGCVEDTLTATYNDLSSVEALFKGNRDEIAAVVVEPVGANMGVVPPKDGFLQGLRDLCDKNDTVLIFDEVITGFRLGFTGAAGRFGIIPDMVTYGKVIGAGMPVGAYGGKKDVMDAVAPIGPVYQAGTLSGSPIAMAAGLAQLRILWENPNIYDELEAKGDALFGGIEKFLIEKNLPYTCNHIGSLGNIFFTGEKVVDYSTAKTSDATIFSKYFAHLLEKGVYIGPSPFESMFLSDAHSNEDVKKTLEVIKSFF